MTPAPEDVLDAVETHMAGPWVWGLSDCCASACSVFRDLHGVDPMADLRGFYSSAIGARRLIEDRGGLLGLAQHMATRAGLREVKVEAPGVIGVSGAIGDDGSKKSDWRVAGRSLLICVKPGAWVGRSADGYAATARAKVMWNV